MAFFILRRLGVNCFILLVIICLSYGLMKIAPGDPFEGERRISPEALAALHEKYEFTLGEYLTGILTRGDFRYSYKHRDKKVSDILSAALPFSLELGAYSLMTSLVLGLLAGMGTSAFRGRGAEHFILFWAMVGVAIPNFVVGPLLQLVFSLKLSWLPVAGWRDVGQKILPVFTLSLMYTAYIARISRGSLLETMTRDFIKTARSKGLSPWQILLRHVLRNSLVPVANFLGPATAALLTGTLVVEKIFNIPGMGRYFVESALQRDYPVALGVLIIYSAMLLLFNLFTDIAQTWIDPRIQVQ